MDVNAHVIIVKKECFIICLYTYPNTSQDFFNVTPAPPDEKAMKIVLVIVLYFSVFNVNVLCYFVCVLKKGAAPHGTIADLGGGICSS